VKSTVTPRVSAFAGKAQNRVTVRGYSQHGVSYQIFVDLGGHGRPTSELVKDLREFIQRIEEHDALNPSPNSSTPEPPR